MKPGDIVVYLADRDLYGLGRYIGPGRHDLMLVEFADGYRAEFHPTELDIPQRAILTTG